MAPKPPYQPKPAELQGIVEHVEYEWKMLLYTASELETMIHRKEDRTRRFWALLESFGCNLRIASGCAV